MQKIKFILIPAFLAAIFVMSCQKEVFDEAEVTNQTIAKQNNNSFLNIPYSDSITLSKFNTDAEIVNYNLARKIALLELDASGFRQELEWEGYTLSKMPVSIYGFDSKPKYYEFIVKDAEGYEVGTVNIEARKSSGHVLNELRKEVKDYDALFSKSGDGMQLLADWSGNTYVGIIGKSGEEPSIVVEPLTGKPVEGLQELSDEEILAEMFLVLEQEDTELTIMQDTITEAKLKNQLLEEEKIAISIQKDSLQAQMEKEHQQRDMYWKAMNEYADSIMSIPDEEIVEKSSKFLGRWFRRIFSSRNTSKYEISKYANNLRYNESVIGDWCGPYALGWLYHTKRGVDKYDNFLSYASTIGPAVGVPIVGLAGRAVGRPMYPREMWLATLFVTGWDVYASPYYSLGKYHAYEYIRETNNPAIIYQFPDHYVTAYGCYRAGNIFYSDYWFAINDNGAHVKDKSTPYYKCAKFTVMFIKTRD